MPINFFSPIELKTNVNFILFLLSKISQHIFYDFTFKGTFLNTLYLPLYPRFLRSIVRKPSSLQKSSSSVESFG